MKQPAIYILTNHSNSVLYIGVTSSLISRVYQHKNKLIEGFTKKYNLTKLVHFEQYEDMENAILREKRLKEWQRKWKNNLINKTNPSWRDLYPDIVLMVLDSPESL